MASKKTVMNITRFKTPLGSMIACAMKKGICLLEFTHGNISENEINDLSERLDAVIEPGDNPLLEQAEEEILEYFNGTRKHFTVSLHIQGTEFQKAVWKILQDIPYGETRSYKQQAGILGKPEAIRAVAAANGTNKVAIIIPCHRVIGEDGSLTGYAGGLAKKRWLLDHERMHSGKAVQGEIGFN